MLNHDDMEVWELHEERLGGSLYLVDRETSVAYHVPRTRDEWPRVAGLKQVVTTSAAKQQQQGRRGGGRNGGGGVGGGVKPAAGTHRLSAAAAKLVELRGGGQSLDLFASLDGFLRSKQQRLKDVFDRFDADHSGALNADELGRLLKEVVPGVSPSQERYFRVMLGVTDHASGGGGVTFDGFVGAIKESRAAGYALTAQRDDEVPPALASLHAFMRANNVSARDVFAAVDADGSGTLEVDELRAMVQQLSPNASPPEVKQLLAGLVSIDVKDTGVLTYRDLLRGLRLLRVRRVPTSSSGTKTGTTGTKTGTKTGTGTGTGTGTRHETTPVTPRSAPAPSPTGDWELEYWTDAGTSTEYLLDRGTMRAYHVPAHRGQWPKLAGRVVGAVDPRTVGFTA